MTCDIRRRFGGWPAKPPPAPPQHTVCMRFCTLNRMCSSQTFLWFTINGSERNTHDAPGTWHNRIQCQDGLWSLPARLPHAVQSGTPGSLSLTVSSPPRQQSCPIAPVYGTLHTLPSWAPSVPPFTVTMIRLLQGRSSSGQPPFKIQHHLQLWQH